MSKVVFITGASSGIGKSIATYLYEKKYSVYGTSRNPQKVSVPFSMIALDVTNADSIKKAVKEVLDKEGKIDVLINNAGKGITGSIEDTPTIEMRYNFETNFFGAIEVIKAVLPNMRGQKKGLIINITSIAGYMGIPFRGVYSASKSALKIITETLSMELKEFGINLVNIAPGDFATSISSGRYHTPVFNDSAYKEAYTKNLKLMNNHVKSGANPIIIAKKVEKIIKQKSPKLYYNLGGSMEKISVFLKKILPSLWYEKLLMNYYKL